MQTEYSDQISELIVDHIREKLGLPKAEVQESVESPRPKKEIKREEGKEGDIELHVSNISHKVTEEDLKGLFEEYGEVLRIKMMKRGSMQKAFIDMETEKIA